MSDDDTIEIETAARQLTRRFDSDLPGAVADFKEILIRKAFAGKVQYQLNRSGRQDVVAALAGIVPLDAETSELLIAETARGLIQSGKLAAAQELLERAGAARRKDYSFQFAAGRVMAEIRQHALAIPYFEAAFMAKPTEQAAERLFLAHLALQQYERAAHALGRILRTGAYRDTIVKDIVFLLAHIAPGALDPDIGFALASLPSSDESMGPALMPHLIAGNEMDSVLAVLERDIQCLSRWDDALLLGVVAYLAKRDRIDYLLKVHERYDGGSATVAQAITTALDAVPVSQMKQYLSPQIADFLEGPDAIAYRSVAASFSQTAGGEDALAMLALVPKVVARNDAGRFFAREKARLARLAAHALDKLGRRADVVEAVTKLVLHFADPEITGFFKRESYDEMVGAIAARQRLKDAPSGTRAAMLREDYFAFYVERRTMRDPNGIANDIAFAEAAFDYLHDIGHARSPISVPMGALLTGRASRTAMTLDGGLTLDMLTNWGLLQAKPGFSLVPPADYDQFRDWYVNAFFERRHMSPDVMNPTMIADLNEVVAPDPVTGLPVTRYLKMVAKSHRRQYDLSNLIDRNLFVLDLIATRLPLHTQFYPFLEPFLTGDTVLVAMIAALGGQSLLDVVHGVVPKRPAIQVAEGVQDVLIIGHASKGTGLGRNFGMLKQGLDGFKVTGLDFQASPAAYNAELKRWRAGLSSRPIAVIAINAHDTPDAFLRDREGLLDDCYTAGFFLWEMTHIPRLQNLGIAMIDEVWAPTRYVADIYAQYKPTHVVGKGLFDALPPMQEKKPNARFTFVTVFDFDSSIERKNPLATALAFRKAFANGEKVELVVKTSNVNPQHWSNAQHQWEKLVRAAEGDSRIRVVTERYTNAEMEALLRDADCVISLHRSEGFGYLMSDAMAFSTPVIATDYSGNADFSDETTSFPVAYRLVPVPEGAARWHLDGGEWADADIDAAAARMREVYENRAAAQAKAARARDNIAAAFNMETFRAALTRRVHAIRASGRL